MKLWFLMKACFGTMWLLSLLFFARFRKRSHLSLWPKKQWLLGHRGARTLAPENTLISFKKALEYGADGVEFDVILSKDAVPMVIHDDTLERTTNGIGFVWDRTALELSKLEATKLFLGNEKAFVPSLRETLASLPDGTIVNIELKNAGSHPKATLVDAVKEEADLHAGRLTIIFSSFDGKILSLLRARAKTALISILLAPNDQHWPKSLCYWWQIKPDALHLPPQLVTKAVRQLAKTAELPIAIWTVNDPHQAMTYLRLGINGIFTDHVPELKARLGARDS